MGTAAGRMADMRVTRAWRARRTCGRPWPQPRGQSCRPRGSRRPWRLWRTRRPSGHGGPGGPRRTRRPGWPPADTAAGWPRRTRRTGGPGPAGTADTADRVAPAGTVVRMVRAAPAGMADTAGTAAPAATTVTSGRPTTVTTRSGARVTDTRPPTMAQIAERAGAALSTVSYVLSGKRPVSEDTRRRVLEAIEELNYRPHGPARALASGASHTIALLSPIGELGPRPGPADGRRRGHAGDKRPGVRSAAVHRSH